MSWSSRLCAWVCMRNVWCGCFAQSWSCWAFGWGGGGGTVCLEAFAVDDGGAGLIVLLLADPHLLEGGQGGQDGASDPDRVFTLRWGNDLQEINALDTRAFCSNSLSNQSDKMPLCWLHSMSAHLNLHGGWGQGCDFLLHPVGDAGVHGGTSRQHSVGIQVLTDVDVALHDAVVGGLMDSAGLHTWEQMWKTC